MGVIYGWNWKFPNGRVNPDALPKSKKKKRNNRRKKSKAKRKKAKVWRCITVGRNRDGSPIKSCTQVSTTKNDQEFTNRQKRK